MQRHAGHPELDSGLFQHPKINETLKQVQGDGLIFLPQLLILSSEAHKRDKVYKLIQVNQDPMPYELCMLNRESRELFG